MDNIKENDIKENDIKENDIKENDIKENDIKENDIKENDIKENDIKEKSETVNIKKSTFKILICLVVITMIIAAFFVGYYVSNIDSNAVSQKELQNAVSKLELKILQNQLPTKQQTPPLPTKVIISIDDDPMKGNPDAKITIIEFSDFQCPFCAKFHKDTLPLLEKNYISTGKVNFVYRDFPIQSIHPNAVPAALASECADDQGKYWEIHDMILQNQNNWKSLSIEQSINLFSKYAYEIGLNDIEFDTCMVTEKHLDEIRGDLNDGRIYGITGTPGFFVGNEKIGFTKLIGAQPFSSFQKVLDEQLIQ